MQGERVIAAPSSMIFELLADPARHRELDGSGWIVASRSGNPDRLGPGATFGMEMNQRGGRYRIRNEVVEFEEGRRIAWRVRPGGRAAALRDILFGGHIWRYELEPLDEGTTLVRESWDYGAARSPWLFPLLGYPRQCKRSIEQTLDRLAERFPSSAG